MSSRGKGWGVRCGRLAFLLLLVLGLAGLVLSAVAPAAEPPDARGIKRAIEVQNKHSDRVLKIQDVAGLGTGLDAQGKPVIRVFLKKAGVPGVPNNLEGVPVVVEVTGEIVALGAPPGKGKPAPGEPKIDPTGRFDRPVPIGVSTGNAEEASAGTLGCRVSSGDKQFALSNNHVYARQNAATKGELILQPGVYDGGKANSDAIGRLFDFKLIVFDGVTPNTIDAAIAIVNTTEHPNTVGTSTPSNGYGAPNGNGVAANIGQAVQKYGRTTALTKGQVSEINVTVRVGYRSGTALFVDQIAIRSQKGAFIKAGDSGSLLVTDPEREPVGLLFAGDNSGKLAIANRIDLVLGEHAGFNVTIDGE